MNKKVATASCKSEHKSRKHLRTNGLTGRGGMVNLVIDKRGEQRKIEPKNRLKGVKVNENYRSLR